MTTHQTETDSRARTEHHDHKAPGNTKHLKSLVLAPVPPRSGDEQQKGDGERLPLVLGQLGRSTSDGDVVATLRAFRGSPLSREYLFTSAINGDCKTRQQPQAADPKGIQKGH
jgi:hypothetical protein